MSHSGSHILPLTSPHSPHAHTRPTRVPRRRTSHVTTPSSNILTSQFQVFYSRYIKRLSQRTQAALGGMTARASEALNALRTVQAFNSAPVEEARFGAKVQKVLTARPRARGGGRERDLLRKHGVERECGAVVFVGTRRASACDLFDFG